MKNLPLLLLSIIALILLIGCDETIVNLTENKIDSVEITEHHFTEGKLVIRWEHEKNDYIAFIDYLNNLTGKKVDYLDLDKKVDTAYGVTIDASEYEYYLFIGDYIITNKGDIYQIDGAKAIEMCQKIEGNIREFDELLYVVNHRYLSIIDDIWDSTYMTKSKWQSSPVEKVSMYGDEILNSQEHETLEIIIKNSSYTEIKFGSQMILEAEVDGTWYQIDDMEKDSKLSEWTLELFHLQQNKEYKQVYRLNSILPLPEGKYRLIKEIDVDGKEDYIEHIFSVKN